MNECVMMMGKLSFVHWHYCMGVAFSMFLLATSERFTFAEARNVDEFKFTFDINSAILA